MPRLEKVILFDLNETMLHQIRTEKSHIASTYAAVAVNRWDITYEDFEKAWTAVHSQYSQLFAEGRILLKAGQWDEARLKLREPWYRENIRAMLEYLNLPLINRWIEKITWAFQDSWVGGLTMPPEYRQTLEKLSNHYCLGLVTNFQQPNIIPDILTQFGLDHLFDVVVISSDLGIRKPHPDLFQEALKRLNITDNKDLVYYVGDNFEDDVEGARYVGLQPILIDTNNRHENLTPSVIRIQNITKLSEVLK